MQELKRSHAEHDAEVRRLCKEMQRMKRRAREQCGPIKIREAQRSIARVLVCLNNGEPTAAAEYVARSNKTTSWDGVRKGKLEADLRDWWKAADVEVCRVCRVLLQCVVCKQVLVGWGPQGTDLFKIDGKKNLGAAKNRGR